MKKITTFVKKYYRHFYGNKKNVFDVNLHNSIAYMYLTIIEKDILMKSIILKSDTFLWALLFAVSGDRKN